MAKAGEISDSDVAGDCRGYVIRSFRRVSPCLGTFGNWPGNDLSNDPLEMFLGGIRWDGMNGMLGVGVLGGYVRTISYPAGDTFRRLGMFFFFFFCEEMEVF